MLACSESTRRGVTPDRGSCSRKDQGAPLSLVVEIILLEGKNGLACKAKGSMHVAVKRCLHVSLSGIEEGLPDACTCVEKSYTDGSAREVLLDRSKGGLESCKIVRFDGNGDDLYSVNQQNMSAQGGAND